MRRSPLATRAGGWGAAPGDVLEWSEQGSSTGSGRQHGTHGGALPGRRSDLHVTPAGSDAKAHALQTVSARTGHGDGIEADAVVLDRQFDAFVHEDLFSGSDPSLRLYDTSFEGVADLNDPSRELDRLDMMESVESLGMGLSRCRSSDIGSYGEILRRVCETLDWSSGTFRGYRCRVDYPLYGTQVAMAWDQPQTG